MKIFIKLRNFLSKIRPKKENNDLEKIYKNLKKESKTILSKYIKT